MCFCFSSKNSTEQDEFNAKYEVSKFTENRVKETQKTQQEQANAAQEISNANKYDTATSEQDVAIALEVAQKQMQKDAEDRAKLEEKVAAEKAKVEAELAAAKAEADAAAEAQRKAEFERDQAEAARVQAEVEAANAQAEAEAAFAAQQEAEYARAQKEEETARMQQEAEAKAQAAKEAAEAEKAKKKARTMKKNKQTNHNLLPQFEFSKPGKYGSVPAFPNFSNGGGDQAGEAVPSDYLRFKAMKALNDNNSHQVYNNFRQQFGIEGSYVPDYNVFMNKQQPMDYMNNTNMSASYLPSMIDNFMKQQNFVFNGNSYIPNPQDSMMNNEYQRQKSYADFPTEEEMNKYSFLPPVIAYDNFGNLIPVLNATAPPSSFNNSVVPFASYTPHPEGGILAFDEDGNPTRFSTDQADWGGQVQTFVPRSVSSDGEDKSGVFSQYTNGMNGHNTNYASNMDMEATMNYDRQVEEFTRENFQNDINKIVAEKRASKANKPMSKGSYLPPLVPGGKPKAAKRPTKSTPKPKTTVKRSAPVTTQKPPSPSTEKSATNQQTEYAQQMRAEETPSTAPATDNEDDDTVLLPKLDGSYQLMASSEYPDYVAKTGYQGLALKVQKSDPKTIKYALFIAQKLQNENEIMQTMSPGTTVAS